MPSILQVEGGHPLHGEITVRGAKNFVPKAMVASLLADTPSELYTSRSSATPMSSRTC